jgi:hypothetical protein
MKNKGFTLLFASLVVSLVLALGLSIASISLQQFLLASSGRESQEAFYNADTGIECALYYDHGKVAGFQFPVSTTDLPGTINCNGQLADGGTPVNNNGTTTTTYLINPSGLTCDPLSASYAIQVGKKEVNPGSEIFFTDIQARGYNTCEASNPRRVERGLEVRY